MSLEALEAQVAHDLATLNHPGADWLAPRTSPEGHVHDVVIVGGGQSGLGCAFALMRERVSNILVLDENPEGLEGPWATYARMATLRTPKMLTGIDLGVPSLTFRAYVEARDGPAAWEAIDKIPRLEWMAYLRWYRRVLKLPVQNGRRLTLVEPAGEGLFRLHVEGGAPLMARKVVLATGIQGGGGWHTPPMIAEALPRDRYAHTSEAIDYAALRGRRIGILGAGASAFDNAAAALEAGVAEAHVFCRRAQIPQVNPIRFMERVGLMPRYAAMDDAGKYRVMESFFRRNQPPTSDMFARASSYPGFRLHLGSPWTAVEATDVGARVTTPHGTFAFDRLVLSTGLVTDPALRPELSLVASAVARWRDRYTPPDALRTAAIDAHPYLGAGFQLLPREPTDADRLHGLFAFNYSALISLGLSASALSGLRYALPRLAGAVADQLFRDEEAAILDAYEAFDEVEFTGRWTPPADEAAA